MNELQVVNKNRYVYEIQRATGLSYYPAKLVWEYIVGARLPVHELFYRLGKCIYTITEVCDVCRGRMTRRGTRLPSGTQCSRLRLSYVLHQRVCIDCATVNVEKALVRGRQKINEDRDFCEQAHVTDEHVQHIRMYEQRHSLGFWVSQELPKGLF
jgi:hypothetical protein